MARDLRIGACLPTGVIAAAGLLLLAITPAAAQESWRVTAGAEYLHITEDEGFLGTGVGGGGGVEWALTDRTTVGLELSVVRHRRDLGFHAVAFDPGGRPVALPFTVRWEGTARFGMVTVAHAFGSASVRPVAWGGAGLMSHGGTSGRPLTLPQVPPGHTLQEGELDTFARRGRGSTAVSVEGGGGADVDLTSRITLRPFAALRLASSDNVGPKYILRTGVRVAIGW